MINETHEQTSTAASNFLMDHDAYEQFELLMPEQLSILDNLSEESSFELDDYFMELELDFDE